jgi:uncharacterized protein YneF (UPF0154 family)
VSSFDWKGTIGKVAPWIATALGGPAAGLAIDVVCKAAGLAPSLENAQKAAEMAAAGSLTGEQFLALRQSEDTFKLKMVEMGYKQITDLEEIGFKDRDSARNMAIQTKDWMPKALGIFVTIGFFGLMFFMMKWDVPPANKDMLNIMLGALGGAWVSIISFYFGSSAGSDKQKDIISKALDK